MSFVVKPHFPICRRSGSYGSLDTAMLEPLKKTTKAELDSQVYYAVMLDSPITNREHTFRRKCIARVLDHSDLCPICRRPLMMPSNDALEPSNQRLLKLLGRELGWGTW